MKITKVNQYHTEIECRAGKATVNTKDGIQLTVVDAFGGEAFIDLRDEEARELIKQLQEAL